MCWPFNVFVLIAHGSKIGNSAASAETVYLDLLSVGEYRDFTHSLLPVEVEEGSRPREDAHCANIIS